MLHTRLTDLLGIEQPVLLGGMGGGTSSELVAAVSNAGGLGILGCANKSPEWVASSVRAIRQMSDRPFGLNLLLFEASAELTDAVLAARPPVFSTGWPSLEQDLPALFARAHAGGSKVLAMVSAVAEARRAAKAGADAIVAQGTEGGGHVGIIGSMVLLPQVVRAVESLPVVAAGGIATGAGLAAALVLGAEGVLLGTRFLATPEAPVPDAWKRAILESDGSNTMLTEIPDVARGRVWPGAFSRVTRNRFLETWLGRESDLRARRTEVSASIRAAQEAGDVDGIPLYIGQDAGLIDSLEPAADVVARIVREAEAAIRRAGTLVR